MRFSSVRSSVNRVRALTKTRTFCQSNHKNIKRKAFKARCHTLHQPRGVAIILRMRTSLSHGQVSGSHGAVHKTYYKHILQLTLTRKIARFYVLHRRNACHHLNAQRSLHVLNHQVIDGDNNKLPAIYQDVFSNGSQYNRPYSYSQYWTGTSLQWRLMRGNLLNANNF